MNASVEDLRATIVPKSDQLNAEQLLAGSITVTVSDVRIGSAEQPVTVHYEGENGRPFRPCKTMRKVLIFAWGPDGREWIGKSMTLYNDPSVRFGADEVGGIRISHMSDIDRDVQVSLTATRGKKALHVIKRLVVDTPKLPSWPQEAFDKQMPRWIKAVDEGVKSVDEILAMARARGVLTAAQELAVRALKSEPQPAAEPSIDDADMPWKD